MKPNISASLTAANLTAIKGGIATIRQLLPFLITLSKSDRRKFFKMGDKSLAFVTNALQAAKNNPDILPASLDVDEYEQDVDLAVVLTEIKTLLAQLFTDVDDTLLAVGSQSMDQSTDVYQYVKTASKTRPGLKPLVDQLGARFVKAKRDTTLPKAA